MENMKLIRKRGGADEDFECSEVTRQDPGETLFISSGEAEEILRVKLPKFIMKRWSTVDEDQKHLGTLRVWEEMDPRTGMPYISVLVPSEENPNVMEQYWLENVHELTSTQYVFSTKDEESTYDTVKDPRNTFLAGRLRYDVNMRPALNSGYRKTLRERNATAKIPKVKLIGHHVDLRSRNCSSN